MKFTRESIQQGRLNQRATEEVSEFIPTLDGAAQNRGNRDLATNSQRMAGQMGARALAMMTNPEEIKRTDNFMTLLKSSPLKSVQEDYLMPPPMVG